MKNLKINLKSQKAITLITLVITIIILLILAGITIATLTGNNNLFGKAKQSKEETEKQTATEAMNLKITNIQMSKYVEDTQLPDLQYLANKLCEDEDMQYVSTSSYNQASLEKINVSDVSSIFTKIKEYPYEFEINSSLQLASIDGVKVATVPTNDDDTIVSMTKAELKALIQNEVNSQLSNIPSAPSTNNNYSTEEQVIGTWIDNKPLYRKTINFGIIPNKTTKEIPHNIKNVDTIYINFGASFAKSNDSGNSYGISNLANWQGWVSKTNVGMHSTINTNQTAFITIEYTKTTDEPIHN